MTTGMVIGLILLPFVWMLLLAGNKLHRDETGVNAPTRAAWRGIRRNARRKGISEAEAYSQWLARKQKSFRLTSGSRITSKKIRRSVTQESAAPVLLRSPVNARIRKISDLRSLLDFEALQLLARENGLLIFKHANGFSIRDSSQKLVENPYAEPDRSSTDFTSRDVEDYLSMLSEKNRANSL